MQISVSTSIGSAILGSPSSAWALINTIQIIAYIPLSSNPLTTRLRAFKIGLGDFNIIPNAFEYIFSTDSTSEPYLEARNYGIDTSVFWINIGPSFTIFILALLLWPFVYLISKCKLGKISVKMLKILGNYKYSFFLRFWTQLYLDVGVFALVQLKSVINK